MRYRYRKDDELKDSGVEWIGKIPKDWEVKKVKHVFEEISEKNYSEDAELLSLYTHLGVKPQKELEARGNKAQTVIEYKIVKKNDIVVNKMLAWMGAIGMSEYNGVISPAYNIYRKYNKDVETRFYHHLFRTKRFANECYKNGWGIMLMRWTTTPERFKDIYIPYIPKLDEKIANFLDEKTSQFDLIISKKEKLIERLEEAKKSLISEVVTGKVKVVKTDDGYELVKRSSEEMKASGVEWLGQIPKDWEYGQLKYLCSYITDGAHISPETENGVYPFLSVKDLKNGNLDFKNCLLTSSNNYEYLKRNSCNPKLGDVLISKDGTIGKTVTIEYDKNFVVASSLVILRPKKFLQPKYFEYILNSKSAQEQINSFVKGAALPRISITHLKEILLPFTSDTIEQGDIVDYLSIELNRIDSILYKINLQIEKLKEAKQSLISEAVTGKIEILD